MKSIYFISLIIVILCGSACEFNVGYRNLLPVKLPSKITEIESKVYRAPGYNQWVVYTKFKSDFDVFNNYMSTLGAGPCEHYLLPFSTSDNDPIFWDFTTVALDKNRKTFKLDNGTKLGNKIYGPFGGVWSNGLGYLYFIVKRV